MEKKRLIILVAAILALGLALGLILNRCSGPQSPESPTTGPVPSGSEPSVPAGTEDTVPDTTGYTEPTVPTETTAPTDTTVPTEPAAPTEPSGPSAPTSPSEPTAPTSPSEPTAPTEPPHVHTFLKGETVLPTRDTPGYTHYTCSSCGYEYDGDVVAALSVQDVVNAQPLRPTKTGIPALDDLAAAILAQITRPEDTPYDKLQAVYDYALSHFRHKAVAVDADRAFAFAGDKVFKNAGEMLISYEAYQILTGNAGLSDHYAAAFTVLTRAIGLESYVVNGTCGGSNHVWNNIVIDGELYAFDAYTATAPQFAKRDKELSGYTYRDREGYLAKQSGFQAAGVFSVTLTVTDDEGTRTETFHWDASQAEALCCTIHIRGQGTVRYSLQITTEGGSPVFTEESGGTHSGSAHTGTLAPGGHSLTVQEQNSMMRFEIQIEN